MVAELNMRTYQPEFRRCAIKASAEEKVLSRKEVSVMVGDRNSVNSQQRRLSRENPCLFFTLASCYSSTTSSFSRQRTLFSHLPPWIWASSEPSSSLSGSGTWQRHAGEQRQLKKHFATLHYSVLLVPREATIHRSVRGESRLCNVRPQGFLEGGGKKRMNSFFAESSPQIWAIIVFTECVQTEVKETKRNELEESRVGGGISKG